MDGCGQNKRGEDKMKSELEKHRKAGCWLLGSALVVLALSTPAYIAIEAVINAPFHIVVTLWFVLFFGVKLVDWANA